MRNPRLALWQLCIDLANERKQHETKEESMLVLSRKCGEEIVIDHPDGPVCVRILERRGMSHRVGVTAPCGVKIVRAELIQTPAKTKPLHEEIQTLWGTVRSKVAGAPLPGVVYE